MQQFKTYPGIPPSGVVERPSVLRIPPPPAAGVSSLHLTGNFGRIKRYCYSETRGEEEEEGGRGTEEYARSACISGRISVRRSLLSRSLPKRKVEDSLSPPPGGGMGGGYFVWISTTR